MGKYHFIAIGGIGMSGLAKYLLEDGHSVTGSDIQDSKYIDALRNLGAVVNIGHQEGNLSNDVDAVIVSTAIKESNPELITRERAIELALSHAGLLHRSDIYDLDAEHDREYGGVFWEVDFENGGYDYSYEINAVTEEIVRHQKERD